MPAHLKIYKAKDKADSYYTKKEDIFDLPARLLIIGKSQLSGKSNLLLNLVVRPEYYGNDFRGENIYIVSGSLNTDMKLKNIVKVKDIPEENLMLEYHEDILIELYDMLQEEYQEAIEEKKKPENKLIIFDDMSFDGSLKAKAHGIINKMYMNGRHINLSTFITSQKYSDVGTGIRENSNGLILFNCSNKQLELFEADHNYLNDKKQFYKMFRDATAEKHTFFVVNYTNDKESMYLDSNFDKVTLFS
jgi:hypothetical protein